MGVLRDVYVENFLNSRLLMYYFYFSDFTLEPWTNGPQFKQMTSTLLNLFKS